SEVGTQVDIGLVHRHADGQLLVVDVGFARLLVHGRARGPEIDRGRNNHSLDCNLPDDGNVACAGNEWSRLRPELDQRGDAVDHVEGQSGPSQVADRAIRTPRHQPGAPGRTHARQILQLLQAATIDVDLV